MRELSVGEGRAILRAFLLATAVTLSGSASAQDSYPTQPGKDWPIYGGSYNNQRYSSLKEITPANARNLQGKWMYHVEGLQGLESVPVVVDGVMYVSGYNRIDALDARTGNVIWRFRRQPATTAYQRGAAVAHNRVYITTNDGHVLALDARTGAQLWESKGGPQGVVFGRPPMVANGKILVMGNRFGIGDGGGFIQAYDEQTGDYRWTWRSVPEKGDPALDTWGGHVPGGGPIWIGGAYDPELKLVYYGTGQPNPQWSGKGRPGDNLYSDCIVALDIDTGKLKWYFQNTPHDTHDYDFDRDHRPCGHDLQRPAAKAGAAGQSQRLLLHSRSHQWRVPPGDPIRQPGGLGHGRSEDRQGPTRSGA